MINLPLNVLQNFSPALPNLVAQNLVLFDKLLEDEKYVPMQFLFNDNAVWKVDLSLGAPKKPLQKISNLYIDALNSQHDVIVYFPDTGYEVYVAAGTVFLAPSLVSRGAYVFYVSLVDQITDATDIVNIFALNISLPYFDSLWQYINGKTTNSPKGNNKSRWFYAGTHISSVDNFTSQSNAIFGEFLPLIPANPPLKFFLKYLNYSFTLCGLSPLNPTSPPPDGKLLSVQIDIVDSINGIIDSRIFTNTQNGTVANCDFFNLDLTPNYTSASGSQLSFVSTVLQGEYASTQQGSPNDMPFNLVYNVLS